MRIYKTSSDQAAVRVDGKFQCFPRSENHRSEKKLFSTVEEAAAFLCSNPEWGIYMNPGGALIYRGICIERDAS